jgi:plasmid maintenance system antidote protein VapI
MDSEVKDIEAQLREVIVNSEMSCYEIAKRSGVTGSQLSLFINGQRTLTLASAAKIAVALGLELQPLRSGKEKR